METIYFGIAISIIGAIIACVDKWLKKSEPKYMKNNIIALLTLFLALGGGWMTYSGGKQALKEKNESDSLALVKEIENKIANDSIKILNKMIYQLGREQLDTSKHILSASLNSNILQQKINNLQSELYNEVIGGKEIPFLEPTVFGSIHPNDIAVDIYNLSEQYPIMNVSVSFLEGLELPDLQPLSYTDRLRAVNDASKYFAFGTLVKKSAITTFYRRTVPKEVQTLNYNMQVLWRNGSYLAQLIFKRDDLGYFKASITYIGNNGKEIKLNRNNHAF